MAAVRNVCNFVKRVYPIIYQQRTIYGGSINPLLLNIGRRFSVNNSLCVISASKFYSTNPSHHVPVVGEMVKDTSEEEESIAKEVLLRVNDQIKNKIHTRLFAVVVICGKKHKVTTGDVIALSAYFPADIGAKIRLEKVLLVGCTDFTLIGRPLLSSELIRVEATVLEKTFTHAMPLFRKPNPSLSAMIKDQIFPSAVMSDDPLARRLRPPFVLLRINSIDFINNLDEIPEVEGLNNRVIY